MVTAHDRLLAVNSREELDGVIEEVRGPSALAVTSHVSFDFRVNRVTSPGKKWFAGEASSFELFK